MTWTMKRALILLAFAVTACAKPAEDTDPKPTAAVTTIAVQRADLPETVTAYGAAEFSPDAEHTLTAPVEAVVGQIVAPAGTSVKAGQPIVILKPSATSGLDLAKAHQDAQVAQAAYARALRLRGGGLASDADVETARAAAASAAATAGSLGARAGDGLILRAPVAGVVESIALAPGDTAAQGVAVAKVGALSEVRVRLGLDSRAAASVTPGASVRISPLSGGGVERLGVVASVDPRLDAQTRLASVIVRVPAGVAAPGEPLQGVLVLRNHRGALVIPRASLLYDGDQPYVFVAAGGIARRHDVKLGVRSGDQVEIVQGAAPGDRVVVDGAAALDDGMAVREAPPAGPAA
jgi:RND family efflux transporter MFP subunit